MTGRFIWSRDAEARAGFGIEVSEIEALLEGESGAMTYWAREVRYFTLGRAQGKLLSIHWRARGPAREVLAVDRASRHDKRRYEAHFAGGG